MPVLHITFPKLPHDLALSLNHSKPSLGNSTGPLSQSASDQSSYFYFPIQLQTLQGLGRIHLKLTLVRSKSLKGPFQDLELLRLGLLPPSPSFSTMLCSTQQGKLCRTQASERISLIREMPLNSLGLNEPHPGPPGASRALARPHQADDRPSLSGALVEATKHNLHAASGQSPYNSHHWTGTFNSKVSLYVQKLRF